MPSGPLGLPVQSRVVADRPQRPPRAETREIVELKQLKEAQPELASAIDMQIALVDMQRLGIFGRRVPPEHPLRDGDRVELYRTLVLDPKEARRRRAR